MTEKKLWTVTIETEIVVIAENEHEATEAAQDALRGGDVDPDVSLVREMAYLPADWDLHSIPFGEGDDADLDRTVEKWIELGAAPEYVKNREAKKDPLELRKLPPL